MFGKLTEKSQFALMVVNSVARVVFSQQAQASAPVLALQPFTVSRKVLVSVRHVANFVLFG